MKILENDLKMIRNSFPTPQWLLSVWRLASWIFLIYLLVFPTPAKGWVPSSSMSAAQKKNFRYSAIFIEAHHLYS